MRKYYYERTLRCVVLKHSKQRCSGARDVDDTEYTRVSRFSRSAFYLRWRDGWINEAIEVEYV